METFRKILLGLLKPVAQLLVTLRIHPHFLSMSGILLGILSGYCFVLQEFPLAIVLFILSALADAVDGSVARMRGIASPFGAFFDNFCSAYTDTAVFGGLIIGNLCGPGWGVAAIAGTIGRLLTYRLPAVVAPDTGEAPSDRFPYALGGKGDRIFIIALGAILGRIPEAVIAVAILTNFVAILRAGYCYRLENTGNQASR